MWFKRLSILVTIVTVAGCQSLPQLAEKKIPEKPTQSDKEQKTPSGVTIHPYDREEIQRQKIVIPEQKSKQQFDDGRQLPAFKSLMQKTQTAYRQGQWSQAQSYAMQAQRLAPQSSETFLYLALIANQQKQPANAESLARRVLELCPKQCHEKAALERYLKSRSNAEESENHSTSPNSNQKSVLKARSVRWSAALLYHKRHNFALWLNRLTVSRLEQKLGYESLLQSNSVAPNPKFHYLGG